MTTTARWWVLALSFLVAACTRVDGDPPATANKPAPPASTPAQPPGAAASAVASAQPALEGPPVGWTRLSLATVAPALTGTIDLPPDTAAVEQKRQDVDADGLSVDASGVSIGPSPGGLQLETMAVIPPRFAGAAAMAAFHGQFEVVSTHDFGPGHWAVVQRWRPGECMIHGWSAAAALSCSVFNAPCDRIAESVQVCGSLRPGPTPNTALTSPATAFPPLEPAAATAAMTIARAVARNDASMLLAVLGPRGLKIGRKQFNHATLAAALAGKPVLQVVAPKFYDPKETSEDLFDWNADLPEPKKSRIWLFAGYGEQPYFDIERTGDDWHLVEFGVEDLGEP